MQSRCDAVVPRLLELLARSLDVRRPVAVRHGRVAIADVVAMAAGVQLVVHLIGERGLHGQLNSIAKWS